MPQGPSLSCHCLLGSHRGISLPTLQSLCPSGARVITGCLSSTPFSLLLLGARLPPLGLALEHRTLCSFGRALRLPPDFSSLCALAIRGVPCRLKKKPSWRSFCSSATQPLPSPRESLITCPPFPPWSTARFTVSPFIPDCTGSGAARLQVASSGLSSLPPSGVRVWADGSVPSLFGPGGAGVHATCSRCSASHSLSFSSGPVASSFTAETFALRQGLAWCAGHLVTCGFQAVLFLSDSRSAHSILSSAPSYLLPESLWNVWSLASSLSNNTTLSFQWVPGHAGLPGGEKADLLAGTGASLPTGAVPGPLPPVIAKVHCSQYRNWRRRTSHSHLNSQVPEVSSDELFLSRSMRSGLSRLRCHGHSLLLPSYLHRISRKENSDCSACGHPPQDLNHLLLDCPASEPLRRSIFGSSLSMVQTLRCGPTVGSPRSSSAPPSLGRGRVVPPPPPDGKSVVLMTSRFAWFGFNPRPGHVVASLDKTFYDDYLCLMASNKPQI